MTLARLINIGAAGYSNGCQANTVSEDTRFLLLFPRVCFFFSLLKKSEFTTEGPLSFNII